MTHLSHSSLSGEQFEKHNEQQFKTTAWLSLSILFYFSLNAAVASAGPRTMSPMLDADVVVTNLISCSGLTC